MNNTIDHLFVYILSVVVDLKHISVCLEFLRFVDNHIFYTAIEAFSQKSNLCFNGEINRYLKIV